MSEREEPLRLPPKPPAPARRRRPTRVARFVLLAGVLLAGALAVHDHRANPRTSVSTARTSTTLPASLSPSISPAPPAKAEVRGTTLDAPTTSATTGAAPTSRRPTPDLIVKLDALTVQDEHPDGFDAALFGGWRDEDHDGCNTRNEVLIAQSTEPVERAGVCRIVSGRWLSPYDGVVLTDPAEVTIDHGVTLREAWESGAWQWTFGQRNAYVNDLKNSFSLKAISVAVKTLKADQDAAEWLPPLEGDVCPYLRDWVDLKTAYKLSVDPGEREAIAVKAIDC